MLPQSRSAATNNLDVAEELSAAQTELTTPTPSVSSNRDAKDDGRDTTNEAANAGNEASVLIPVSDNRLGSNRRPNSRSDQVAGASTPVPVPESSEKAANNLHRDHVVDGFPFPAATSSPTRFTTPSTAAGRPTPVTEGANASFFNSTHDVSVPAARPGDSSHSASPPDPPRVMLALREKVGNKLYAVGERLLRCIEADHREMQGKAYRPIPITGAERDKFHACLHDATRGPFASKTAPPRLDSGAGPRRFWEAMAGPRLVDARWNLDAETLEEQLWSLATLVREQDEGGRRQPIPLNRCERLRRTLDARIYEILLLYVRTQMIWDGINDSGGDSGGGGEDCDELNEYNREFRSCGEVHHHGSTMTPSG